MNTLAKLHLFVLVLLFFSTGMASGQSNERKKLKDYRDNPRWIQMKEDSTVNYFDAVKAFDEFWKDRKAPVEDDVIGEEQKEKEWTRVKKILNSKEYKKEKESEEYRFEHKKFKYWQLSVEPYVQPDGRILSSEEQLEIWKTQRK